MPLVYLTKGIEFSAAHRYLRDEWTPEKNREVFGACYNEPGHGHNYFLDVTVAGDVESQTGMVVNLYDLKIVLLQMLEEFDHKHLNYDTPYFKDRVPTLENVARVLWKALERHRNIGQLSVLELAEDEDLSVTLRAENGLDRASISRRFEVPTVVAGSGGSIGGVRGPVTDLWVTVQGPIDDVTGMITDLRRLDRIVREHVVSRWDTVRSPRSTSGRAVSGEELVRRLWTALQPVLSEAGQSSALERVKLVESRDLCFECSATGSH
ncbi:MAG: 6-carboxytetrahydropterin synthase [Nitrospiraceae bacterium]